MSVPSPLNYSFVENELRRMSPAELCRKYSTGSIPRELLIQALTIYPYKPMDSPQDELDDLIVHPAGSWAEVEKALRHGHITDDIYDEVADMLEKLDDRRQET